MGDADQFDLVELVLAQDAAGVLAGRPGLGAEAGRMGGDPNRQVGLIEDGTAIGTALAMAVNRLKESEAESKVVILLTDGLPTQGDAVAIGGLVSARERLELFLQAVRRLPGGVPINTLLFPMEGDPFAAGAFWQLAVTTKGAFITPSRDWP